MKQRSPQREVNAMVRKRRIIGVILTILRHVFLLGLCYVVLYPVLYMISNAFKPISQYYDPSVVWIPRSLTFDNFYIVFKVMDVGKVLLNTLLIEILPAFISTFIAMFVGYGLARFRFKGRGLILACVILTIIVPPQTISTSLYSSYRYFDFLGILSLLHRVIPSIGPINLIGTPWVTILPALFGVGLKNGIFIFIFMQFFTGLPKELQEAAAIDGCGPLRTFLRIILPTAKNIIIAVLLLAVVWNWNDYYTPAMYIRTTDTMATAMASFQANLENLHNMGTGLENIQTANTQIQAAALIAIFPLVILYVFLQKRFSEGIEDSGLTGI
ncbi:MAG: carbohydrate ABC transporter permease [Clostridia bacterium]|nr:carbohydrate ABC transporter permease [Clostridia bacterium]